LYLIGHHQARANATIKQQEDLNTQAVATAQREQAVAEQELKLWDKEEQGYLRLERELKALASRKATIAAGPEGDPCRGAGP
jgi:hypothetical protein